MTRLAAAETEAAKAAREAAWTAAPKRWLTGDGEWKAARSAFDAGYNAGRASLEPVATALYEALETTREAWSDALSIREPDYWSETEIAEHRVIATKADAALAAARDAGIGS